MRRPLKALTWSLAGLVAFPVLLWLSSLLYWHFRINSAMKSWKMARQSTTIAYPALAMSRDTGTSLHAAGCRALPYLVATLDANDDDPKFQQSIIEYLIGALSGPPPFCYSDEAYARILERTKRWQFRMDNSDLERKAKLDEFRGWWSEHGRAYHSWWNTWSDWCGGE